MFKEVVKLGIHTWNPSRLEMEAGGSGFNIIWLHSKFKASISYVRSCLTSRKQLMG